MSDLQQTLVESAKAKYGIIYPCGQKAEYRDCFTNYHGQVMFWFNTSDNSTHVETASEK